MQTQPSDLSDRLTAIDDSLTVEKYNYDHFRTKHLLDDAVRSIRNAGLQPGQSAPDFELPRSGGGSLRLSTLRGMPVVLHFGSYS